MNKYQVIFIDQEGNRLMDICYAPTPERAKKRIEDTQKYLGRKITIIKIKLIETI